MKGHLNGTGGKLGGLDDLPSSAGVGALKTGTEGVKLPKPKVKKSSAIKLIGKIKGL